jgi:DNA-binding MarR family transcriptional regulator
MNGAAMHHVSGPDEPAPKEWIVSSDVETVPEPALTLEDEAGLALVLAGRSVLAVYRRLLEPLGLTHPQYLVMVSLWQYGPLSVRELGQLLHLESATLSPLVKRLENMGLLVRRRSETDERVVVVTVTERGLVLRAKALSVPGAIAGHLRAGGVDMAHLFDVLGGVVTATGPAGSTTR